MSFWWEDGYVAGAAVDELEKDRSRKPDASGLKYMVQNRKTDVHHLHASYSPKLKQLISLDGCGKQDTRIRVWCSVEATIIREFPVHCKSGFIAVSGDGMLVAVAVLKEDTVEIYELGSGDLLISLDGGRKEGFWGSLKFLPGSNILVELRSLELSRGVSKRNIMRCWDLGFSSRSDPSGDDRIPSLWTCAGSENAVAALPGDDNSDDDEVEDKKWEIEMWKGPVHITYRKDMHSLLTSSEEERKVCTFEAETGNCKPASIINDGQWCSKTVFSSDYAVFALSHTGSCSIRSSTSNSIISVISMPDVPFPVTPLAFIQNDRLLLLRVNLDRHLILCDWRNPDDMLVLRETGGTTSDSCAVSPDEKYLAFWPHGFIEYYSLPSIVAAYMMKYPRMNKITMLSMRILCAQKRAVIREADADIVAESSNKWAKLVCHVDDDVFRYILSFI